METPPQGVLRTMKKSVLRGALIVMILIASSVMFIWYWSMKREVPVHARVIPSDAIAVLTLNPKELAKDLAEEGHLFPEFADQPLSGSELAPILRAVEANNGKSGVNETADILAFVYQTGDEAFAGAVIQLNDSAEFGNLIRAHLSKEFKLVALSHDGIPVMQFDTTAAAFGWTNDAALLLYPLGNHGIATVSTQCLKLLKQQKESSVLMNENFCAMELSSFAMSLWVQTEPLITLTEGGAMIQAIAHDVVAYSYLADFEQGEILIRSEWLLADENKRDMIREFAFPCDTSLINYFVRGHFDPESNNGYIHSLADAAIQKVPVAEAKYAELFSGMTGDFISISNINSGVVAPFETYSFLLSDGGKTKQFITAAMERDSIPLTPKGWCYSAMGDSTWRMILDDDMLTITNHPDVDGRHHTITPNLAGYMAWFNLRNISSSNAGIGAFFPISKTGTPLLADHVSTCTSTLPVQFGNVRHSEIVVHFVNKEVNALVQAEELLRKIFIGNR